MSKSPLDDYIKHKVSRHQDAISLANRLVLEGRVDEAKSIRGLIDDLVNEITSNQMYRDNILSTMRYAADENQELESEKDELENENLEAKKKKSRQASLAGKAKANPDEYKEQLIHSYLNRGYVPAYEWHKSIPPSPRNGVPPKLDTIQKWVSSYKAQIRNNLKWVKKDK